ncbi:MAG: hypothetical protein R2750_12715 [Bacteroidales bacterium]
MNTSNPNRRKVRLLVIFILLFIPVFYFVFFTSIPAPSTELEGTWLRSDGTYSIKISEVKDDGKMKAEYFNPGPIHVAESRWEVKDKKIQIFVKMQDKNYPGSYYNLSYNEKSKKLIGTYYQAVQQQTFDVSFEKRNN